MKKKLNKPIRIIECISVELSEKDLIQLKNWDDFIWMMGGNEFIYKLQDTYYLLNGEIAHYYNGIQQDTKLV